MDKVWLQQVLIDTPWWIYAILAYLVIAGFRLSKPRIVTFKRLYRIPIVLAILSFGDLFKLGGPYGEIASSWCVAAFTGILFAWWLFNRLDMRLDKENQLVQVPGSWIYLMVFLLIFSVKYYIGYQLIVEPARLTEISVKFSIAAVLGTAAGFYIGLLLYAFYQMKNTTAMVSLK